MMFTLRTVALAAMALAGAHVSTPVWSQVAPDGGRLLQEIKPGLAAPKPVQGIEVQPPAQQATEPGGVQVVLSGVRFSGHTVFSAEALQAVIADSLGQRLDLAGLRGVADAISAYYRRQGYPFARALLPAQTLTDGVLHIEVVEGRYGQVRALAEDPVLAQRAQPWLDRLTPGAVIDTATLERVTLLLGDLPGIQVSPLIRPGQTAGTGDLDVRVQSGPLISGELGLDNAGNRYTGQHRVTLNLDLNSPLRLGDRLSLRALTTDEKMWFGSLDYSAPLGTSGWRLQAGLARSAYTLGQGFASLQATGTADVRSLGLSFPLKRSPGLNLYWGMAYQYKQLSDRQGSTSSRADKTSSTVPLTLRFDVRDSLGQGGLTYGQLGWTLGSLRLDAGSRALDQISANSEGQFDKFTLDMARLQALPGAWTLYTRLAAQWATSNLDSSEGFGLGGADAVRAYPSGEAYGDRGWIGQIELRRTMGPHVPYLFYDIGRVTRNARPWEPGDNQRTLAGTGLGWRVQQQAWTLDASVAWRTVGGAATSDTAQRVPRVWVALSYRF